MIEFAVHKSPSSSAKGMRVILRKGKTEDGEWHAVGSTRFAGDAHKIVEILNKHYAKKAKKEAQK